MTFTVYVVGVLVSIFIVSIFIALAKPDKMEADDVLAGLVLYLLCVIWFISVPIAIVAILGFSIGKLIDTHN